MSGSDDDEIRAIHAEFRAGLPARLERMRELAAQARRGARADAVQELKTLAHRLRGACGSFDMHELEGPSRRIEMECKGTPSWGAVDAAIAELDELIKH